MPKTPAACRGYHPHPTDDKAEVQSQHPYFSQTQEVTLTVEPVEAGLQATLVVTVSRAGMHAQQQIGRASCRERVYYVV